jgi:hypothetical protein
MAFAGYRRADNPVNSLELARKPENIDASTGEGVGEGLANLAEAYNCIAHNVSPIWC